MNLRDTAHTHLNAILNHPSFGGVDVKITSPAGQFETLKSLSNDIFQSIDPGTGQIVSGRVCTVSVLIADLIKYGFSGIKGIAEKTQKPWIVETTDVYLREYKFKVVESHPDISAGLVVLFLEVYK